MIHIGDNMFADFLTSKEITFKHANGCRDLFGKEFHTFHEMFLLIGDTANFSSDSIIEKICQNSLVIIPKGQFHQFDHIGEEKDYHRYVIQFANVAGLEKPISQVFDRVKLFRNVKPETIALFKKLENLIGEQKDNEDKDKLLHAIFTEMLFDLKYNYTDRVITEQISDEIVLKIIAYIHAHFTGNITIKNIADHCNFSETYISHKFKDVMHTSVYKYILQKKLIHAHSLIVSGVLPTQAAISCGFDDYSGFYKNYKQHFGFSPSQTNKN